jgi:hypothetical protein
MEALDLEALYRERMGRSWWFFHLVPRAEYFVLFKSNCESMVAL